MARGSAFTLIEILVVVVLLGVLAAIVIPVVANSTTSAKDTALAADLHLLRRVILVYKSRHLEVGPGYPDGDTTQSPTEQTFIDQVIMASNSNGETAAPGTAGYDRGPYVMKIPVNPFNKLSTIQMLGDGESFPANADDSHGWIYKAATSEIRADSSGTDQNGKPRYDY